MTATSSLSFLGRTPASVSFLFSNRGSSLWWFTISILSAGLYPALLPSFFFLFPLLQTKFIPLQRLRYYPTELQRNQHCCTAVSDCECIVFLVCCLCALKLLLNCSHGFPQTKKAFYVTVFIHKVILFLGKKSRNSWKTIFLYVFLSKQLVLI